MTFLNPQHIAQTPPSGPLDETQPNSLSAVCPISQPAPDYNQEDHVVLSPAVVSDVDENFVCPRNHLRTNV